MKTSMKYKNRPNIRIWDKKKLRVVEEINHPADVNIEL